MPAGDFSASQLYPIIEGLDRMWGDPRTNRDKHAPIEVVKAIAENQNITLNEVLVNGSCRGYEVAWLQRCVDNSCECETEEGGPDCELTADELESVKATYDAKNCLTDGFTVWDDECKGLITAEQKTAEGFEEVIRNLIRKLNMRALGFLNANIDDNSHVVGNIQNVPGAGSYFPSGDWSAELMAQIAEVAIMNKIENPVFVSGTNLWGPNFNAQYNARNCCGKDEQGKLRHFPNWYWDMLTVDSTLGEPTTLAFDQGSVGFINKVFYPWNAPRQMKDKNNTIAFSMPYKQIKFKNGGKMQDLRFDVLSQYKCKTLPGGIMKWGRVFKVFCHYDFITSPEDCNGTLGILKFVKGEPTPVTP